MCSKQCAVCVFAVFFKSSKVQTSVSLFTSIFTILTSRPSYKICICLGGQTFKGVILQCNKILGGNQDAEARIKQCNTILGGNQDAEARMKQCNKILGGNQDAEARIKQCNKILGG